MPLSVALWAQRMLRQPPGGVSRLPACQRRAGIECIQCMLAGRYKQHTIEGHCRHKRGTAAPHPTPHRTAWRSTARTGGDEGYELGVHQLHLVHLLRHEVGEDLVGDGLRLLNGGGLADLVVGCGRQGGVGARGRVSAQRNSSPIWASCCPAPLRLHSSAPPWQACRDPNILWLPCPFLHSCNFVEDLPLSPSRT
jgi:hypothetical protein